MIFLIIKFIFSMNKLLTVCRLYSIQGGWMDELGFYVPSTVFQSFQDDGRVNMKGSVQ